MNSIVLLSVYFGDLPDYFNYFIETAKTNKTIQFVIYNDRLKEEKTIDNIHLIPLSLVNLNQRLTSIFNTTVTLNSSWKINEIKPLFALLFPGKIKAYDFWGWCDIDIIWGNIRNFMTEEILEKSQVISTKPYWTAGHFTLFKNTEQLNKLALSYSELPDLLNDEKYYAFEECCHRWNDDRDSQSEIIKRGEKLSMYNIIRNEEKAGRIQASFLDIIVEHPMPILLEWVPEKIMDVSRKREVMYFHLITVKKIWRFYLPKTNKIHHLYISESGIRINNENFMLWNLKKFRFSINGIIKSIRRDGLLSIIRRKYGITP